jgi:hypothetical protein
MSKEQPVECREAFEAHTRSFPPVFRVDYAKNADGSYKNSGTRRQYELWQAAWNATKPNAECHSCKKERIRQWILDVQAMDYGKPSTPKRESVDDRTPSYKTLLICLKNLVVLKKHKDEHGKDEWYQQTQPGIWRNAIEAVSQIEGDKP